VKREAIKGTGLHIGYRYNYCLVDTVRPHVGFLRSFSLFCVAETFSGLSFQLPYNLKGMCIISYKTSIVTTQ